MSSLVENEGSGAGMAQGRLVEPREGTASRHHVGRLRARLAALSAVSQAASRALDLDQLFRAVYEGTSQALDVTGFILGLYDAASQTVEIVRQMDSGVALPGGSFPLGSGFTSEVIRTRRPRLIRHWSRDEPRVQVQYATDHRGLPESGITVPLLAGEQVVGVLSLQSYEAEAYDEDDLLMLQAIAGQTGAAIENLRHSQRRDAQLRRRVSELEIILASMADALVITDTAGPSSSSTRPPARCWSWRRRGSSWASRSTASSGGSGRWGARRWPRRCDRSSRRCAGARRSATWRWSCRGGGAGC
ncbi:MAG: GAF domain-containing protein [Chloroflexota bacterium]|nr:GAF domain-containing protein [Chloroflexota bacterium]